MLQSELDVSREMIVSANSSGWSVEGQVSEEVVLAWEHHLEELLEGKSAVTVVVEELHKGEGLGVRHMVDGVVSQEVNNLSGGDEVAEISVQSLECRVRSEVADVAESLSGALEVSLAVANCNQKVFESSFRFVT